MMWTDLSMLEACVFMNSMYSAVSWCSSDITVSADAVLVLPWSARAICLRREFMSVLFVKYEDGS